MPHKKVQLNFGDAIPGKPYNYNQWTDQYKPINIWEGSEFGAPKASISEQMYARYAPTAGLQLPSEVAVSPMPTVNPTPTVNPMSLYNRQGRADYTPQNIISDEVIQGDPRLGSLPDPRLAAGAYAEEAYYIEQDRQAEIEAQQQALLKAQGIKEEDEADTAMFQADFDRENLDDEWEERNALRVLQAYRLKEIEAKRQEQFAPAAFDPEEFSQRVAGVSTPSWLGNAPGPMTDAARESIFSDTDDFGNPLSTDAFGQTNYGAGVDQQLNVLNSQYGGINYEARPQLVQPSVKSKYPGHYTPWMIEQLESQRKRNEFFQGIGDTVNTWKDKIFSR